MRVYTEELFLPKAEVAPEGLEDLRRYFDSHLRHKLPVPHRPIRFVITETTPEGYRCELDIVTGSDEDDKRFGIATGGTIFDFRKRDYENTEKFNAVLLIPTGVGAEVGGHCGDGNATARLMAHACDTLITHPNVVNASDINEMTDNTLYVEGSILTRLLMGHIGLQPVKSNRLLMLMDKHADRLFNNEIINAVSSARISLGLDCDVHEMEDMVTSISRYSQAGRAVGEIQDLERVFGVIERHQDGYDAIGLSTFIKVPPDYHKKYFSEDSMVNPWGGIEAMLTHSIAEMFNIPCAHSPMMTSREVMGLELGIVDPRKAPETASVTYLHCILKGLHRSPRVVTADKGLTLEDVSCIVIPDGCVGLPTLAAIENGIPVIAVRENKNNMKNDFAALPFAKNKLFIVENYWEAVGVMTALKAGIEPKTVRRPIAATNVI